MAEKMNVPVFISDLHLGVFEKKIAHALSTVAAGVITHSRAGKVTLTFDVSQIGAGQQVMVAHKIGFKAPTENGSASEEDTTKTAMYVGEDGNMTIFPEGQGQLLDKHGAVNQ